MTVITPYVLFTDKLWFFEMPDHDTWKPQLETIEKIETNKAHNFSTVPTVECNVKAIRTGWFSHRQYPVMNTISQIISQTFLTKIAEEEEYEIPKEFEVINSWLNIYKKGQFAAPHKHGRYIFSAVYFVRVPQDSGAKLCFHKREKSVFNSKRPDQQDTLMVDAKEGTVMIFNGYLLHSVTPNASEKTRLTMAANYLIDYRDKKTNSREDYVS